tara:strand:+ start:43 stop:414 length:372 start_codon:yes stop_codon:yes gene_type:complete
MDSLYQDMKGIDHDEPILKVDSDDDNLIVSGTYHLYYLTKEMIRLISDDSEGCICIQKDVISFNVMKDEEMKEGEMIENSNIRNIDELLEILGDNIWKLHNYNTNSYTPVNHEGVKITKNEVN